MPMATNHADECRADVDLAIESQHHIPGRIHMRRVYDLTKTRLSDAQDNVWPLRKDPKYFADHVTGWAEHSVEVGSHYTIIETG